MAFYNIYKREIYDKIKDELEVRVSERQFYYLLSGKNYNKVSERKKLAAVNYIQQNIPVKDWLNEYVKLNE